MFVDCLFRKSSQNNLLLQRQLDQLWWPVLDLFAKFGHLVLIYTSHEILRLLENRFLIKVEQVLFQTKFLFQVMLLFQLTVFYLKDVQKR